MGNYISKILLALNVVQEKGDTVFYLFVPPLQRKRFFSWGGTIRRFFQILKIFFKGGVQLEAKFSMIFNDF